MAKRERKRILLVDDDRHLLIALSDYLMFEGFDVIQARSGEEALRKMEKADPNLIILDICMPGMGGTGFLKRMPRGKDGQYCPVLVLTARSAMEDFFDKIDVEGFLAKPCSEATLLREIKSILARKEALPEKRHSQGKRILLAENDAKLAEAIQRALKEAGYRVTVVRSGPAILERSAIVKPHLILMKDQLPRIKGSAVAPLLKSMPSVKETPVLIYDKTLEVGEDRHQRYRVADGASKVLASDLPEVLLHAVDKSFSA